MTVASTAIVGRPSQGRFPSRPLAVDFFPSIRLADCSGQATECHHSENERNKMNDGKPSAWVDGERHFPNPTALVTR
jgi:hypothetical protein